MHCIHGQSITSSPCSECEQLCADMERWLHLTISVSDDIDAASLICSIERN